jgi:hypothetical protein
VPEEIVKDVAEEPNELLASGVLVSRDVDDGGNTELLGRDRFGPEDMVEGLAGVRDELPVGGEIRPEDMREVLSGEVDELPGGVSASIVGGGAGGPSEPILHQ